jgi:hypothetical protein
MNSPSPAALGETAIAADERKSARRVLRPLWRDRVNTLRAATRSCTRGRITRQSIPARETRMRIVKPCRPSAATDGRGEARKNAGRSGQWPPAQVVKAAAADIAPLAGRPEAVALRRNYLFGRRHAGHQWPISLMRSRSTSLPLFSAPPCSSSE